MIDIQLLRVEAARMTAQVLQGSGADPERTTILFWHFMGMMIPQQVHPAEPPAANRPNLTPIDGGKKD